MSSPYSNWIDTHERVGIVHQQAGSVLQRALQARKRAKLVHESVKKSVAAAQKRLDNIHAALAALK